MQTGSSSAFYPGEGHHSGEPFFIPRDGAESEDDGYLMTYMYDANRGASDLVILDARDLSEPPLARVHLPARVPYGFHGAWVPDDYDGPSV